MLSTTDIFALHCPAIEMLCVLVRCCMTIWLSPIPAKRLVDKLEHGLFDMCFDRCIIRQENHEVLHIRCSKFCPGFAWHPSQPTLATDNSSLANVCHHCEGMRKQITDSSLRVESWSSFLCTKKKMSKLICSHMSFGIVSAFSCSALHGFGHVGWRATLAMSITRSVKHR